MEKEIERKPFYNSSIPNEWDVKSLDDLGEFKNGINKDIGEFGHGCPLVGLMDVFGIPKIYNTEFSLVNSTENERRDFDLRKGDVLFVRSSVKPEGVGLTTLVCEDIPKATFSGFLIRFRNNGKLDFEFKAHCFFESNFRQRLLNKSTISANTNINQVALKSLKIALPSLPEQKAIAHILSLMDTAISKNNSMIAQKELQKKWLMQNLLTGKKRLKGFEEEWKEVRLGDVIEISSSKRVLEKDWKSEGVPFYRTREIIKLSNGEKLRTPIFISEKLYQELKQKYGVPKTGDVLVTGVGTIGESYVVREDDRFYFKDGNVLWFKMNEKINSNFLNQQFKTFFVKKQLSDNSSITTVATFTIEGAKNTKIKLPSTEEQSAIAQVLQTSDKEICLLKTKSEKLKEKKKWLMQVLLTGKKRINCI